MTKLGSWQCCSAEGQQAELFHLLWSENITLATRTSAPVSDVLRLGGRLDRTQLD